MDKVRNPSNSVCYTPSSEPYRIYMIMAFKVINEIQEIPCKQLLWPNLLKRLEFFWLQNIP
jgi:hypothetical protein